MDYLELMKKYDSVEQFNTVNSNKKLVEFLQSDFWVNIVNDEINSLKENNQWDSSNMQLNYVDLQNNISHLLRKNGLPDLAALQDGFSTDEELNVLQQLRDRLN